MENTLNAKQAPYILAIDLGGTTAKCALIQKDKIVDRVEVKTQIGNVLENIHANLQDLFKKYNIKGSDLELIAVTICGLLDYDRGVTIFSANLQWNEYPVVKRMQELFENENVFILNDSKSATYGEYIEGLKKEKPNVILYTIGTGIGGGVILNKELYFGNNSKLASEPGHGGGFQTTYNCNCNLPGCVEGLSSATGMEKELNKERDYINKKLNLSKEWINVKDIKPLIEAKDEKIMGILEFCLEPLAKHIAVSLHLMDFDIVVIGGGPSALKDDLLEILNKLLKRHLLEPFYKKLDLRIATLGNDAGIWGAYYWAKNKLFLEGEEKLITYTIA